MARITEEDPRYLRVRASLVSALFELAAEVPADEISVSQLASAAGVSRTTFYSHSSSPAQLLADTLVERLAPRLDALADEMTVPGVEYVELWREAYTALLEHVQEHRAVYETLLATSSFTLSSLVQYLESVATRSVDAVVAQFAEPHVTALWRTMAIQQQVRGSIAMIKAWLDTGLADPPDVVIDTYLTLAPPWQLARPDETGHITLRRIRSAQPAAANSS
ncbi:MAG: TetR/AcrR family transcriptional regulator C-terminal domain-containing protein [Tessaracoccus sp.]|uniref:TetR/AcrR family transcriptional regulator n=1 Tax=Tessaracoccus sp. TaxID=1971211 RepID=UPI001EB275EF|nr:TetR/AcrR family transcriptional regulator [Tessaracoccus sp.]MBK7822751.1 TetR/AcrR family transcriptional regulator C-terminal domain-containing protein [Tessaracoccus sp.]